MVYLRCFHSLAPHFDVLNAHPRQLDIAKEDKLCVECGCDGADLYYCLFKGCASVGCLNRTRNHIALHLQAKPSHYLFYNLASREIICMKCEAEMQRLEEEHEDADSDADIASNNTPDRNHIIRSITFAPTLDGEVSESSDDECDTSNTRKLVGLVGLQNIGNTCYMNAALQALSNTIPLRHFFLECPVTVQILSEERKPGLSRQYQTLIRDMWLRKSGGYVTPSGILYGIRNVHAMFRGYHQHDTQEFLRNFMDQLHEELKQVCPPECSLNDVENICMSADEPALGSSYESSEGEYETCDSGVSERSSLSDDNERPTNAKRRLSRSGSPGRRMRARMHSNAVIEAQPSASLVGKKTVRQRSIISDIFDGKLLSSVQCLTCDRVSSRVETFQDLSLPIPSRDHLIVLHGRNIAPGVTCSDAVLPVQDGWFAWIFTWLRSWFYGPTVTLHDCLAAFFSTDELKGDNMYSCERCNKLRNGLKYSKVLQLPEVLCIHLKRFRHELMFSSKISAVVSFPLKGLDMRPYLHKDCVSEVNNYELFSVICHHGTAGGGHYTCYALNNGQWFEFDDQCVTRVHPETVQGCEAYVLFYRKVLTDSNYIRAKAHELAFVAKDYADVTHISRQWLSRFATCAEPGPIDNSDFVCLHNSVHPKRAIGLDKLAVPIARSVYDFLYKKFGGCAALSNANVCAICQALYARIASESERLAQLNISYEFHNDPATHLLSNAWYTQWKHFVEGRIFEPPGPIDNTRASCSQSGAEEYIEINKEIWLFFHNLYSGGPELLIPRTEGCLLHGIICEEEHQGISNELGRGEPLADTEDSNEGSESKEDLVPISQATTTNHSTSNSNSSLVNLPTPEEDDYEGTTTVDTITPNGVCMNGGEHHDIVVPKIHSRQRQRRKEEMPAEFEFQMMQHTE